ncbi:hypothetical protein VEZ01S_25_00320 [Vibrio ezurae NBRC 102218]|uniref:Uncharacterized protein n=1 Tax=Vibrio ezurae NBRC 102218 TaxID=1219080 RepID=U3CFZ3_9VIBR|nr:hypothetical protein VEZ01S_25_00320 [Vibrio ezurae NBRC 102218]
MSLWRTEGKHQCLFLISIMTDMHIIGSMVAIYDISLIDETSVFVGHGFAWITYEGGGLLAGFVFN